jgi:hypothetical protein
MHGDPVAPTLQAGASRASSDGDWSAVVDGLRGRLILTPVETGARPQLRIDLELENMRAVLNPLEIWWRSPPSNVVKLSLEDEAGPVVSPFIPGGNEHAAPDYWLPLPMGSAIRISLSASAYEDLPDGRTWLRPFTFVAWEMPTKPVRHFLSATVTGRDMGYPEHRPWKGVLALPRVPLPPR